MITIFNRESLWIGRDMKRFNEMRDVLEREKIPYTYRTRSSGNRWMGHGTARGSFGSVGSSIDLMYEYEIFVLRKDLERARYLVNTY
ncbi:hypothetical protein [Faecalicatena fissicatena]|uniref:DUF2007 domain-containing protein n=1 Tax=Faecalicatena fissicatena TaxID=290055 RepID=A0ABS2E6H0_9FIRM|nr:hypothetical protein [Faecalicatena fissicatena]MBM6737228.1 hypothetical protein [Faecalicatena fissicatena]